MVKIFESYHFTEITLSNITNEFSFHLKQIYWDLIYIKLKQS